jgi:hypothetical protein
MPRDFSAGRDGRALPIFGVPARLCMRAHDDLGDERLIAEFLGLRELETINHHVDVHGWQRRLLCQGARLAAPRP